MIGRLKRRAEFLQVAAANRKWVAPGLILQVRRQPEPHASPTEAAAPAATAEAIRVGFTASRKVGNAVARNRAKRRLRALTDRLISCADPAFDYVLVGRTETLTRDFADMEKELREALKRIAQPRKDQRR